MISKIGITVIGLSSVMRKIYAEKFYRAFLYHISERDLLQAKSLLVHWADKGHSANTILAKMEGRVGASAPSYLWVTQWLRGLRRGEDISEPNERLGRPKNPLADLKVVDLLNSKPFTSVRQTATTTKMPRSTVFNY
jgi:hypothetical protein